MANKSNKSNKTGPRITMSLQFKAIVFISSIVILVAIVLSIFFIGQQKKAAYYDLMNRGMFLVKNLAYNSEYGVLIEDEEVLEKFIRGLIEERDIAYIIIQNAQGDILSSTKFGIEEGAVSGSINKKALTARDALVQIYSPENIRRAVL